MANAAMTSAVPTTPLTAAWTGNQVLELVKARAYRGTSAPMGKIAKVASAPQMMWARRAASDGPLEEKDGEEVPEDPDEPEDEEDPGTDPDVLGVGVVDGEASVSVVMSPSCIKPYILCWANLAEGDEDPGLEELYAHIRLVLFFVVSALLGRVNVIDVVLLLEKEAAVLSVATLGGPGSTAAIRRVS